MDEQVAEQLADLPIEKTPKARAAAWARIIALSTLGGEDMVAETSEAFMAALAEAKDRRKAESKTAKARGMAGIYAVSANGSEESAHGRVELTDAEIQSLAAPRSRFWLPRARIRGARLLQLITRQAMMIPTRPAHCWSTAFHR